MVEGVTPLKLAELAKAFPSRDTHMREHLEGIRNMADEARFGTDQDAKDALGKIVLACRCALK